MESFLEYVVLKVPAAVTGIINCAFAFGMINVLCLVVLKKRAPISNIVLTALCISMAFNLPLFAADWFFFTSRFIALSNTLSLFILPPPIFILLYYYLFRKLLRLSQGNVLRILEPVMLAQYMVMLVFMSTSSLCTHVLQNQFTWARPFSAESLSMLTTDLIVVCVWLFVKGFSKQSRIISEIPYGYPIPDTKKELVRIFLSVSCFYIVLVAIRGFVFIPPYSNFLQPALHCVLLIMLFYRFFTIIQRCRLNIIEWQAKASDEYIRSLISANEEFRSLKHDIFNILQVYDGYLTTQDLKGLRKYHNSIVKTTTCIGTALDIIEPLRLRKAIYSLFSLKVQLAKKHDIDMKIFQPSSLIKIAMNDLDLCRILGNLIDNAIDAAADSDEKKVIVVCCNTGKGMVHIIITNSTGKGIDIDLLNQGISTKPNHMGHGLTTVRNIIASYDRCFLSFTTEGKIGIPKEIMNCDIESNIKGTVLSANLFLVMAP